MASKKIRDLVVKVGSYQDRNTGEEKARWENVGALMQNDEDKALFIMLKRTFNPAGVPGQNARESILISAFVPQGQRQQDGGNDQQPQGSAPAGGAPHTDYDDDIPFSPQVL